MKSAAIFHPEIRGRRNSGSTLAAALALAFLVFAVTMVSLTRIACTWGQVSMRHRQTSALFLAEAGVRKAGQQLLSNRAYTGEKGTALPTGTFDVSVKRDSDEYAVISTGIANSGIKTGRKRVLRATIKITSPKAFRIEKWVDEQ